MTTIVPSTPSPATRFAGELNRATQAASSAVDIMAPYVNPKTHTAREIPAGRVDSAMEQLRTAAASLRNADMVAHAAGVDPEPVRERLSTAINDAATSMRYLARRPTQSGTLGANLSVAVEWARYAAEGARSAQAASDRVGVFGPEQGGKRRRVTTPDSIAEAAVTLQQLSRAVRASHSLDPAAQRSKQLDAVSRAYDSEIAAINDELDFQRRADPHDPLAVSGEEIAALERQRDRLGEDAQRFEAVARDIRNPNLRRDPRAATDIAEDMEYLAQQL